MAANPDVKLGASDTKIHFDQNILATYNLLEAMRKNKSIGLGKKNLRPLDDPIAAAGGFQGGECSLVNPDHVQRFQIKGRGPASQIMSRL